MLPGRTVDTFHASNSFGRTSSFIHYKLSFKSGTYNLAASTISFVFTIGWALRSQFYRRCCFHWMGPWSGYFLHWLGDFGSNSTIPKRHPTMVRLIWPPMRGSMARRLRWRFLPSSPGSNLCTPQFLLSLLSSKLRFPINPTIVN